MKNDLTTEQLLQPVTVTISLGAVLRLAELDARGPHAAPPAGRYDILPDCLPSIGSPWDDASIKGGIYAGITVHDNTPMALVLLPASAERKTWQEAREWVQLQGGELPSRFDSLVLFKNLKSEFEEAYYWTSEEAGNADCAWIASFGYGSQRWGHKSYGYRCRAVRRVAI